MVTRHNAWPCAPEFFWPARTASVWSKSPPKLSRIRRRSGGCVSATIWADCQRPCTMPLVLVGRVLFSSRQRGQIERQEFEYIRHGTLNLLAGLNVYNGHMWAECLDRNDSAHFQPALRRFLHPYGWAKQIHLILDEGPSHVSASTRAILGELAPRVRVLLTPVDASWLNQAELLLEAFSVHYLTRGDWATRTAMINHIGRSCVEYNDCFAHPFDWQWTRRAFRLWLYNTPGLISCNTCATRH